MTNVQFTPHSHSPYGVEGTGFYSDNTLGCFDVVDKSAPVVKNAIESVLCSLPPGQCVVICDYGAADGGISIPLLTELIGIIKKKRGEAQEVHIIYEDQITNDFKSVFRRVQGQLGGQTTYLQKYSGVYVTASATNFFSQCLPSASLHLGISSTAMHWLSRRPCELTDSIHHALAGDPDQVAAFSHQSALDWETILLHRAAELTPGGHLVLTCLALDDKGQFLGHTVDAKECMLGTMNRLWKDMAKEGVISQDEFRKTAITNYYRTKEEFSQPFKSLDSKVTRAGLRLVELTTQVVRCCYHLKWLKDGVEGDEAAARKHAQWFIPNTRTWSNSSFLSALSDDRSSEEKASIVDEMFHRYEDLVASSPADHAADYVHACIHIKKI